MTLEDHDKAVAAAELEARARWLRWRQACENVRRAQEARCRCLEEEIIRLAEHGASRPGEEE